MRTLWRISNYADLSGEGGRLASARWHTEGRRVVYLAESPAGAMLERIVHLSDGDRKLPKTYDLLEVAAADGVLAADLEPPPDVDWKTDVAITRALGDKWLVACECALARVPSVIVPRTWNFLFNPEHPEAARMTIMSVIRERFDPRLFRVGGH
jgi:RES domain-containing protein